MVYGSVVIALCRIKIAQACLALCLQLLGELGRLLEGLAHAIPSSPVHRHVLWT